MATSSSVIILFFTMGILSCCTTQEILKIWRESSNQVDKDDITVPESQCVKTQQQCDRYNAKHLTQCLCSCDKIGGEVSAFWEPNSTCIPVSSLRQQSECQLLFTDEKADQRLKFFPYNKTSLEKDVAVPTNQSCTFYYGDKFFVQYLDCGGSWKPITSSNALSTIELTPGWSTTVLKMRIKGGSTVFAKLTAGHLVRVPIQCRRANSTADLSSSCIVFMSDGQVECPYPKQTVNATHTIHPATLPTPVTRWLNWTEANRELETSTQTEARPMTTDGRLLSRPVENSTGSSLSPATSSLTTSATESSTSKVKRGAGTNNVVIGIAVGCAVVFVIFLCFLVLLCKRRKSKKSQQETKSADRNPVVEIQIGRLMEHFSTSGEQESQSTYQELISNSGQGGTGHNTADDNSENRILSSSSDDRDESIQIDRFIVQPKDPQTWKRVKDSFVVPSSACYQGRIGTGRNYCNESCTKDDSKEQYSCECPPKSATVTFVNNSWICLDNMMVRKKLGCADNTLFHYEREWHQLYTLSNQPRWGRKTALYNEEAPCVLNTSSSWVIGCHGEKTPVDNLTDRTKEIFVLGWSNKSKAYYIKVVDPIAIFQGRIINLGVSCSQPSSDFKEGCLLFKLEGNITCPLGSSIRSITIPAISSSVDTSPSNPTTTGTKKTTYSTQKSSVIESSTSKAKRGAETNGVVIGIAVGCAVGAIIFLSFLVLLCKRRKSKNNQQESNPAGQGNGGAGHNTADDNSGNCHIYQSMDMNTPATAAPVYENMLTPATVPNYQNEQTLEGGTLYESMHNFGSQTESAYEPLKGSDGQNVYERLDERRN